MAKELAKTGALEMDLIYVAAGSRGNGYGWVLGTDAR